MLRAIMVALVLVLQAGSAFVLLQPRRDGAAVGYYAQIAQESPPVRSAIADVIPDWTAEAQASFLTTYWQKKPVLIRGLFFGTSGRNPRIPSKEDLLQLSTDDDVESRILMQGKGDQWTKEYGPFEEAFLKRFRDEATAEGKSPWTVLVQEVDRHIPAVADLWAAFDFVPAWRRDDVMMSYASPGGGIGAHVDNYDVFLLQGRGRREWSIEGVFLTAEQEEAREVRGSQTRLIRDFGAGGPVQTWTLEAGDVLYLPPRVPHRGTALDGGCTTVSFGFRAPAYRSLLTALTSFVCEASLPEGDLYADPDLHTHSNSAGAEVSPEALERIRSRLGREVQDVLGSPRLFGDFVGRYLTEPLRMQGRSTRAFFIDPHGQQTGAAKGGEDDYDDDDESSELPLSVSSSHAVASTTVFSSAEAVLEAALRGQVLLRRAEGVRCLALGGSVYYNGEPFPLPELDLRKGALLAEAACSRVISSESLGLLLEQGPGRVGLARFLCSLLRSGLFYPVDKK